LRKGWIERVRGWDEKGKMSEGVREECFIEFSEIKILITRDREPPLPSLLKDINVVVHLYPIPSHPISSPPHIPHPTRPTPMRKPPSLPD